jgi:hypothetical protein
MENLDEYKKIYYKGFNDELYSLNSLCNLNEKEKIVYNLGKLHAYIGDDVTSMDYVDVDLEIKKILKK